MPVLPFHRYIGPGNKSDNGEPVDEDDRIAREHDINYDNAKTEEDIRKADIQAIILFRKNWLGGNWHSLIGDVGLSVKYFIESFTGVLYPDIQEILQYQKCEVIVLGNILKLHCVNKRRALIEKYNSGRFIAGNKHNMAQIALNYFKIIHNKDSVIPYFVYIPLNWTELYFLNNPKKLDRGIDIYSLFDSITFDKLQLSNFPKIKNKYKQHIPGQYFNKFVSNQFNETFKETNFKKSNFISSIYSGNIFIDQDWNLIQEQL